MKQLPHHIGSWKSLSASFFEIFVHKGRLAQLATHTAFSIPVASWPSIELLYWTLNLPFNWFSGICLPFLLGPCIHPVGLEKLGPGIVIARVIFQVCRKDKILNLFELLFDTSDDHIGFLNFFQNQSSLWQTQLFATAASMNSLYHMYWRKLDHPAWGATPQLNMILPCCNWIDSRQWKEIYEFSLSLATTSTGGKDLISSCPAHLDQITSVSVLFFGRRKHNSNSLFRLFGWQFKINVWSIPSTVCIFMTDARPLLDAPMLQKKTWSVSQASLPLVSLAPVRPAFRRLFSKRFFCGQIGGERFNQSNWCNFF